MPPGWRPGMPVLVPDPENPGQMIEIPQDAFVIQEAAPSLGADIDSHDKAKPRKMKKKKKKKKVVKNEENEKDIKDLLFKFTSAIPDDEQEKALSPDSGEAAEATQELGTTLPTPKNEVVDSNFQTKPEEPGSKKQPDLSASPQAPSVSEGGRTSKTGDNSQKTQVQPSMKKEKA